MPIKKHPRPEGYFEERASDALAARGLVLPESPTPLESKLMAQLLLLSGAAERVLSDVDDDGVAEAADMAVLSMSWGRGNPLPLIFVVGTSADKRMVNNWRCAKPFL